MHVLRAGYPFVYQNYGGDTGKVPTGLEQSVHD